MFQPVELHELEVFQAIEEFTDAAVDRALGGGGSLPSRQYESEVALKIRLLLAEKKLTKYSLEVTRLNDLKREAGRELARAFKDGVGYVQLPHVSKRKIAEIDRQIEAIQEEAKLFALKFGWRVTIIRDPETEEYQFQKTTLRETLCKKF